MRVTNKMLSNSFLSDMRVNLEHMKTMQQQLTSGKEIRKPSDDPFKVARAMQLHTDINTNKQYKENISDTINWLDTTDTALGQAGNVLQRIRELLVSSGNAGYSPNERRAIKDEINAKMGEMAQILNTNFDGKYIFGGTRGTTKPVDVLNPYVSDISGVTIVKPAGYTKDVAVGSVKGDYLGNISQMYKVTTKVSSSTDTPPNKVTAVEIQTSTDNGANWSTATNVPITAADNGKSLDVDIGNGMTLHLEANNAKTITNGTSYEFKTEVSKPSENTKLQYYKRGGGVLATVPEVEVKNISDWENKKIVINFDGKEYEIETGAVSTTPPSTSEEGFKKLVDNINTSITKVKAKDENGNDIEIDLSSKLTVSGDNGNIKFTAVSKNPSDPKVKITGVKDNSDNISNIPGLENFYCKEIANKNEEYEINMISSKLNVEISQGVTMDYSVSASDVINFKNEKGEAKNLMDIFSKLVNHLDGKSDSGSTLDDKAVQKLINGDLQDVTDSISNFLKIRSQIGASQNRMDGAKDKNTDETFNMTEILSKTEDIDITEKVMEFATAMTVYLASLQTSAKVLQPTLMDYIR